MLINPRKRRRKTTRRRRRRRRRNPIQENPGVSAGMDQGSVAVSNPRRTPGIISDVALTTAGAVGSMLLPERVFKVSGTTKYLVQGGLTIGTMMFGKTILGRKLANKLTLGFGIGMALTLANDLLLKPRRMALLGQEEEEIEIPEIEAVEPEKESIGQNTVVITPEDEELEDVEPEEELTQENEERDSV